MITYCYLESPIGTLRLVSDGAALIRVELPSLLAHDGEEGNDLILTNSRAQLERYFAGKRRRFKLPLAAQGTRFQQQVWNALTQIPYGTTCSYADIANTLNKLKAVHSSWTFSPTSARAVGAANGSNPIPIIVPCHRVIGSNGRLTGYAGGLEAKRLLLELEGVDLTR